MTDAQLRQLPGPVWRSPHPPGSHPELPGGRQGILPTPRGEHQVGRFCREMFPQRRRANIHSAADRGDMKSQFVLGTYTDGNFGDFNGQMKYGRYYNIALTDAEIQTLSNEALA